MSCVTFSPPNAIVFVLDPENSDAEVPSYVDGQLTAATASCVSVGTQADVDGETEVSLAWEADAGALAPDMHHTFTGIIETPANKLAVVTSQSDCVLEMDVQGDKVEVSISVDDLINPARVAILVRPVPPAARSITRR